MSNAGEKVSLNVFLADLTDDAAAEAKTAAAKIDELARVGHAMHGIEDRFKPYAIAAGALFVLGLVLFFLPDVINRWFSFLCLIALPGICAVYAFRTRERTWADKDIDEFNKKHFLPHGGIYFPRSDTPAGVIRVNYTAPAPEPPPGKYPKDPRKPENYPGPRW